ncbi:MAG: hypothetical protein IKP58_16705 [Victivallales bacterium]|nr:hypothetical protein [Victivallales bacterium]
MTIFTAVSRGDIHRTTFEPNHQIPLYLGSGCCGALFDCYGLIGQVDSQKTGGDVGTFKHASYYAQGHYGIDYWLSLFTLKLADMPQAEPTNYRQSLSLYKGYLETSFEQNGKAFSSRTYFHPYQRDILAYELHGGWRLTLSPVTHPNGSYNESFELMPQPTTDGFRMETNRVIMEVGTRIICEKGRCDIERNGAELTISLSDDAVCLLLVGSADASRFAAVRTVMNGVVSVEAWRQSAEDGWKKRWGDSYLDLTDAQRQSDWARSMYYVLCSFSPDGIPSAPMGWTGAGWRFHFPQDISYIHPALLRMGQYDLAKRIVEFYYERIDDIRAITHRIYGGRGTMWAWEFPIGTGTDLLKNASPNPYQYEIHNAAYPARMAYETSLHLNDAAWTAEVALPVIRESAEFYASHLVKEANGRYSLEVMPSMSQDEFAKPNGRNYLCALYSARYTFRVASAMGLKDYDEYLKAGLAFDRLIDSEHGIYCTGEIMLEENFGKEKHPVQLNPLIFLPSAELDKYERNAYEKRYDICSAAKSRMYHGWTLAMFWLASSHLGRAEDFAKELSMADDDDYRDAERLEFYESSKVPSSIYYVTTHGVYLQAVQDAFVCDLFGDIRIEGCIPTTWKGSEYVNLHARDGKVYSGRI